MSSFWQAQPTFDLPDWLMTLVQSHGCSSSGRYVAQLLWQRGIRDPEQIPGFLDPACYSPTSPFAFGPEMDRAVQRLQQAWQGSEKVAIWGDFDADGVTATAVLWEGLGRFFTQPEQLTYFIPNRLTESHGLSIAGLERLTAQGYRLIVTCDTGSTNLLELERAQRVGIDVIVTDHHTLPAVRPNLTAILNPRSLSVDHPLATLSGVAIAYKLVEALYETLPEVPPKTLTSLLDLVAIGLIADRSTLTGDNRYLAQRGIEQLQNNQTLQPAPRPGVARLLELCKRSGDRPTDISFGLGPRINAISQIQGNARFCVDLLTTKDGARGRQLAAETELANARRKALQKEVFQQVVTKLAQFDLSTTAVIVLSDPQWPVGILGLVAEQVVQAYGRPTILLNTEAGIARGSARSPDSIDLYQLVQDQAHLLHCFGGHPQAASLSLPVENISLFTEAINRQMRQQWDGMSVSILQTDLTLTVAKLGKNLFRELKLLEPYGMGNPVPKLRIENCWFERVWHRNLQDWQGQKLRYIKTEFELWDDSVSAGFPGVWWEHYRDEVPTGRCDAVVELDYNPGQKRYEVRLIAVRPVPAESVSRVAPAVEGLLDWRTTPPPTQSLPQESDDILAITTCPSSWEELQSWIDQAHQSQRRLALAYPPPTDTAPLDLWQRLVGIAKSLNQTGKLVTSVQLSQTLGITDRSLQVGLNSLQQLGLTVMTTAQGLRVQASAAVVTSNTEAQARQAFLAAVHEEQFQQRYFYQMPLTTLQALATQTLKTGDNKNCKGT